MHALRDLLDHQSGVASRRQLRALGLADHDVRRLVRRRSLVVVHRGVYVNHTGPLTWVNRAWAAVLYYEGSALCGPSALNLAGLPIHVAIPAGRKGVRVPDVVLHQLRNLEDRVLWNRSPPRLRVEDAALDVAGAAATTSEAVAVISDALNRRATTPERILAALDARERSPRGAELREIITDAAKGSRSVLERAYLVAVERNHGLPRGARQAHDRVSGSTVYRDVLYEEWGVAVELDGLVWHGDGTARKRDMARDLTSAAAGLTTLRVGWHQVKDQPCRTASQVGQVLSARGWTGRPRPCGAGCAVTAVSSFPVTG